eukprot:scaffold97368_cov27-Tisochrysis_lutea.AAC.2
MPRVVSPAKVTAIRPSTSLLLLLEHIFHSKRVDGDLTAILEDAEVARDRIEPFEDEPAVPSRGGRCNGVPRSMQKLQHCLRHPDDANFRMAMRPSHAAAERGGSTQQHIEGADGRLGGATALIPVRRRHTIRGRALRSRGADACQADLETIQS